MISGRYWAIFYIHSHSRLLQYYIEVFEFFSFLFCYVDWSTARRLIVDECCTITLYARLWKIVFISSQWFNIIMLWTDKIHPRVSIFNFGFIQNIRAGCDINFVSELFRKYYQVFIPYTRLTFYSKADINSINNTPQPFTINNTNFSFHLEMFYTTHKIDIIKFELTISSTFCSLLPSAAQTGCNENAAL